MKWFEGSINEAVATSKSRRAVFVVFVEGKDDTSVQFGQAIDVTEVSSLLEQEHFVAIRIESDSEAHRFFAQIYQLVPVPSLFFIGENGTPLEIVAGNVTVSDLTSKIKLALAKAGKGHKVSSIDLIDREQEHAAATTSNSDGCVDQSTLNTANDVKTDVNVVSTLVQFPAQETKVVNVNSTVSSQEIRNTSSDLVSNIDASKANNSVDLTSEEKLERAKQLIELQRKQRQQEDEKKEKEKELERRKMGRDVQKLRQKQQDLEIKQAHEERLKEKAAEAAARDKVRQQIAQDKLERKQKELALQQQVQQKQVSQEQSKVQASLSSGVTVSRIQFRLPTGNPHMAQFLPTNTLRTLRTYVIENIDLPFRQFAMSTSFPRRDLTSEDDDKTLLELELVPTAVILILPLKHNTAATTVTSTQDVNFFSRFMWSLFTPIIGIYNYLMLYLSGRSNRNLEQRRRTSVETPQTVNNTDGSISTHLQEIAQSSGLLRRNVNNQSGTTIKTEGNIHRLHSSGDDNDENNTWNGNSTQQM